jgi:hypothetical protein
MAHEKWFTEGPIHPSAWDQLITSGGLKGILIALAATVIAAVAWRRMGGRDLLPGPERFGATPESRQIFYAWVPALLAAHLAVPLFILGLCGKLFSPNHLLAGSQAHLLVDCAERTNGTTSADWTHERIFIYCSTKMSLDKGRERAPKELFHARTCRSEENGGGGKTRLGSWDI